MNDAKCGRILDNYFVPYRENDEYTKATKMTVQAVISVIAEEYEVEIQSLEKPQDVEEDLEDKILSWAWIIIIIAIIILVALCCVFDGGGSSEGFYGGTSGGFSSGGFGGGFSGGGGASR